MNYSNLRSYDKNDPESVKKARENGRLGGIASGESKRRNKQLREFIRIALEEVSVADPDKSKLEHIAAKYVKGLDERDDIDGDDIQKLQKILGEEMTTVNANVDGLTPGERLNRLMNGEE